MFPTSGPLSPRALASWMICSSAKEKENKQLFVDVWPRLNLSYKSCFLKEVEERDGKAYWTGRNWADVEGRKYGLSRKFQSNSTYPEDWSSPYLF